MESGPSDDIERMHLHVVCFDPDDQGETLIVPVASHYNGCDSTCILVVGNHEFIKHKSYISYKHAQKQNAATLQMGINTGMLIPRKDILQYFLLKIRRGVEISGDTIPEIKDYYKSRKPNNG